MPSRNFPLENVVLVFGFVGTVCLLGCTLSGISVLRFIGGAMVGILLIPALLLIPVMLTMRLFGIGRATVPEPIEKDAGDCEGAKSGERNDVGKEK